MIEVAAFRSRHSANPLPSGTWRGIIGCHDLAHESVHRPNANGRLWVKVLVFKRRVDALAFAQSFDYPGNVRDSEGFVLECATEEDGGICTVDPRFVCVIGLLAHRLCLNTLAHECVHAAFSYTVRTRAKTAWPGAGDHPEEHIAWPAGNLCGEIWRALCKAGLA